LRNNNPPLARRTDEALAAEATKVTVGMAAQLDPKRAQKEMLATMFEPFKGMTQEQVTAAFVKEATLVRRRTSMMYCKSNDWALLAKAPGDAELAKKKVWFGTAAVSLSFVDNQRTAEVEDLKDPAALEARLNKSLQISMTLVLQMQQKQYESRKSRLEWQVPGTQPSDAERRTQHRKDLEQLDVNWAKDKAALLGMAFKVFPRKDFGEHTAAADGKPASYSAYILRVVGSSSGTAEQPGLNLAVFCASLRNGGAIAEITFSGNIPEEEMLKDMDRFLFVLDGRTKALEGEF
jgi:hypothetical protein